jgi:hypothetical protein
MLNRKETAVLIEKLAGDFYGKPIVSVNIANDRFVVNKFAYENTDIGAFYTFEINDVVLLDCRLSPRAITDNLGMPSELLHFLYPEYRELLNAGEIAMLEYMQLHSDSDEDEE